MGYKLFQVLSVERLYAIEGNRALPTRLSAFASAIPSLRSALTSFGGYAVVQIAMRRAGNDEKFLVPDLKSFVRCAFIASFFALRAAAQTPPATSVAIASSFLI